MDGVALPRLKHFFFKGVSWNFAFGFHQEDRFPLPLVERSFLFTLPLVERLTFRSINKIGLTTLRSSPNPGLH
jgi:hypothetical protein